MGTIFSIGEVLWDLLPDGEYLGGAPFNFAANCARLGNRVLFLSAVGQDPLGQRTLEAIEASGVSSNLVSRVSEAGTGIVRVEFDADGQPHYTIDRPAAYDRSEEHTSELQSQSNLVCRLLLEKKKNPVVSVYRLLSSIRIVMFFDEPILRRP